MKRSLIGLLVVLFALLSGRLALADVAAAVPLTAPLSVYADLGPLQLTIPGQSFQIVALYDFVSKQPLVGAETPVARLKIDKSSVDPWDLQFTAGAVTDERAKGAPIVGVNLEQTNAASYLTALQKFRIGVFAGYNPNAGNGSSKPIMAGAKMAYEMRFW